MSIDETVKKMKALGEHFGPNSYPVIRMNDITIILDELEGLQTLVDKLIEVFDVQGTTRKEKLAAVVYKAQALASFLSYDVDSALMESLE